MIHCQSLSARVLALGAVLLYSSAAQAADTYRKYTNARFGTTVMYPANLISIVEESDNGDGARFASAKGDITFSVFASHNATGRTLRGDLTAARNYWTKKGGRTTYWKYGSNWFATSGFVGQAIFYEKTVLKDNVFHTITWLYPSSLRKRMDAPVTRSVASFTAANFIRPVTVSTAPKDRGVVILPTPQAPSVAAESSKARVTPTRAVPRQNPEPPAPAAGY